MLCWAAIALAAGCMLIPKGYMASLMAAERIDLDSITGTHGIRLPDTLTHRCKYICIGRAIHSLTMHYLFMHQPHTSVQNKELK